jgi:hypothetical protein
MQHGQEARGHRPYSREMCRRLTITGRCHLGGRISRVLAKGAFEIPGSLHDVLEGLFAIKRTAHAAAHEAPRDIGEIPGQGADLTKLEWAL